MSKEKQRPIATLEQVPNYGFYFSDLDEKGKQACAKLEANPTAYPVVGSVHVGAGEVVVPLVAVLVDGQNVNVDKRSELGQIILEADQKKHI